MKDVTCHPLQRSIDDMRRWITSIEMELMEEVPDRAAIHTWANLITAQVECIITVI